MIKLEWVLWALVALSLLPASVLVARRVVAEGTQRTVTMLMDEEALREQAAALGRDPFELALHYQSLGLNGIALYEETPESLAGSGRALALRGFELRAAAAAAGREVPELPADSTALSEVEAGALAPLLAKSRPQAAQYEVGGRLWHLFPGDSMETRPAGPDSAKVGRYAEAGFDIAYRPRNFPNLQGVGSDFPAEASYLVHAGLEVAGHPNALSETVAASQQYLTGIIEGTEQDGMAAIAGKVPTVRLLSFNQDYVNRRLHPLSLIDKYLLAANERGVRMLYLRPYTQEQLGDMLHNTESLVAGLRRQLEREGYRVGPLETLEIDYRTGPWLRSLAAVGILAGLGLLALLYPGAWGALAAGGVLALGLAAGGLDWNALALMAALTFPVIGFGHLRERLDSVLLATLISLAGAALLVAVGSDRESMLGIAPFRGVAATLVVPPALFLFHYALRFRRPAQWVKEFWGHPVRIGDVAVVLLGLSALALVFLRRGNFPVIGVSELELSIRAALSELFVRPRFKELLGHPMAVLALVAAWPAWGRAALLTGGVVAQASILNSFSHYHTPLAVSLERTVVALLLGLAIGLLLSPLARGALLLGRRWLTGADSGRTVGT